MEQPEWSEHGAVPVPSKCDRDDLSEEDVIGLDFQQWELELDPFPPGAFTA